LFVCLFLSCASLSDKISEKVSDAVSSVKEKVLDAVGAPKKRSMWATSAEDKAGSAKPTSNKAVVWQGPNKVTVKDVGYPKMQDPHGKPIEHGVM
jgi:hypothetical protein